MNLLEMRKIIPVSYKILSSSSFAEPPLKEICKFKNIHANCFCASFLRIKIHMPRHASSSHAKN